MARPVAQGTRADAVVLAACIALALLLLVLPRLTRDRFASTIRNTVGAPLVSLQHRAERSRVAMLAHDSTTRVIDSLVLRSMATQPLRAENDQLRGLLGLGSRLDVDFVPTEVIGAQGPGEGNTVLLAAGTNAGIERRMPVVAPQGLVGLVRSADPLTSEAILLSHPDFRVSAMSADGRVYGMVQPYLPGSEPLEGVDREEAPFLLRLTWVRVRDTLPEGTLIVTSGLGVAYPVGIPVGTVIGELPPEGGGFQRTYLLRPAVTPADVRLVMVVRHEPRPDGLIGVWQLPAAADSALRAVRAAADSIVADSAARVSALLRARELQRRLADSLRADSIARSAEAAIPRVVPPATPQSPPLPLELTSATRVPGVAGRAVRSP